MTEEVKAISQLPIIKNLNWIIPSAIVLFAAIKIYSMVIDAKLKAKQNNVQKYVLMDYAQKYPDSELTKELKNSSYLKKVIG